MPVLLQKCFRPLDLTLPLFAQPTLLFSIYTSPVSPEEYIYHIFRKKVNSPDKKIKEKKF